MSAKKKPHVCKRRSVQHAQCKCGFYVHQHKILNVDACASCGMTGEEMARQRMA